MRSAPYGNFCGKMVTIPRFTLIELHEEWWFPAIIRKLVVELLVSVWSIALIPLPVIGKLLDLEVPVDDEVVQILGPIFRKLKVERVVDVCAGAGGPWFTLASKLSRYIGRNFELVLTDLHPQVSSWKRSIRENHSFK